ncbi:amidase domain-containing protein [Anaeromicropila herbilytica]|uniref:Putative amidase domain-containing protein n=1 Tax=Anaeromicropila herbilytica TaxID=2785025 RepID=A0A7R7IF18_9FIRM|nr:amidase domain-containing protein [Anaeromicropila herbilytica]BCN31703.1 hypothetical protein bsdtb5_29980 [Anaeromicropila herbilytica]
MATIIPYNRQDAVNYALKWDRKRNPKYYDFSNNGDDSTNFISQCLYEGSGIMNNTKVWGWYYNRNHNYSPSWTNPNLLYQFLTTNTKKGIYAKEVPISQIMVGDVIQLAIESPIYNHSLLITDISTPLAYANILTSTHDSDSHYRALNTYIFDSVRFLHIEGVYL